jgi:HD-GYP domain-containing protein (c-di-GMP phosphodiesterase class II)
MGSLLCAFAYASDLAFGLQLEDSLRSCYVAVRIAAQLGLSPEERTATYYAALLKDAGCTSWTSELAGVWQSDEITARRELMIFGDPDSLLGVASWMRRYVATDMPAVNRLARYVRVLAVMPSFVTEAYATSSTVARQIATRLGMPEVVVSAVHNMFQQWDGKSGARGLSGEAIPLISRIVLPTFFIVAFHRSSGREAATNLARALSGKAFDPGVIDAFLALAAGEAFWRELESDDIQDRVLAMEPASPWRVVDEARVENIALAFADFIDLKSRYAAAHSRRVAAVAEQVARLVGCAEEAVAQIRRAALMHDLGLVAVPSYSLDRPWSRLSESEKHQYRLHPYHGERILRRVPFLAPLAEMVGSHQERLDGSGYYRGLSGAGVSLGARIIAVADRLDEITHGDAGQAGLPPSEALAALGREALDTAVVGALRRCLGDAAAGAATPPPRVAGLSERELQVLRLAAQGLTRRDIGRRLAISENTVRHHLEHVYNKTGTSNRVTATLFAMENGLLLS